MDLIPKLLAAIDAYKIAAAVPLDSTLSSRMFADGKKITGMREGRGITVGRLEMAFDWIVANWPEGKPMPANLVPTISQTTPAPMGISAAAVAGAAE